MQSATTLRPKLANCAESSARYQQFIVNATRFCHVRFFKTLAEGILAFGGWVTEVAFTCTAHENQVWGANGSERFNPKQRRSH